MIRTEDCVIDAAKTLGNDIILIEHRPVYQFKDGIRTETVEGYRCTVALPDRGFNQINVKLPLEAKPALDEMVRLAGDRPVRVKFTNLNVKVYVIRGKGVISIKADDIQLANPPANRQKQ